MSEVREVGAGGAGGVDVQETRAPVGIHMRLAMRGFDDDRIESSRILSVREEEGAVVEVHAAAADHEGEVIAFENCGGSGVPEFSEGFASEQSVGEQADATRDLDWTEAGGVECSSDAGGDGLADACCESVFHGLCIDDGDECSSCIARLEKGFEDRVTVARRTGAGGVGGIHEAEGSAFVCEDGGCCFFEREERHLHAFVMEPERFGHCVGVGGCAGGIGIGHAERVGGEFGHVGERVSDEHAGGQS